MNQYPEVEYDQIIIAHFLFIQYNLPSSISCTPWVRTCNPLADSFLRHFYGSGGLFKRPEHPPAGGYKTRPWIRESKFQNCYSCFIKTRSSLELNNDIWLSKRCPGNSDISLAFPP